MPYSPKFLHSDDIHLNTKFIACENLGLYGIMYSVLCTCTCICSKCICTMYYVHVHVYCVHVCMYT